MKQSEPNSSDLLKQQVRDFDFQLAHYDWRNLTKNSLGFKT